VDGGVQVADIICGAPSTRRARFLVRREDRQGVESASLSQ
jgi:hypothetical protein